MRLSFTDTVKRKITLVIILLLMLVFCGSIDLSCDVFSPGASIRGNSTAISSSLITSTPLSVREDNDRNFGSGQDLEKASVSSDFSAGLARKLLKLFGSFRIHEASTHFRDYSNSVCITCYAYLFLLTHICFIHLKDGSK